MNRKHQIEALDKERRALELAKAGVTYDRIAQEVGYASRSGAHKAVQRALNRSIQPDAEEFRKLQMARLNDMRLGLWPKVRQGVPRATEVAIKIEEREARLLGLDAPEQVEQKQDITVWLKNVDLDAL